MLCSLLLFAACESASSSAYEIYKSNYIELNGGDEGLLSETDWLNSLNGETGKSAYDFYVEAYTTANGSTDGVLSESDWLASLKGDQGVSIKKVEIVCGDIIIYFDDDTSETIIGVYPEAGHNWNEGEITTAVTCLTPGVKTYTCNDCGAKRTELLNSESGSHVFGDYSHDETTHSRTCTLCGYKEEGTHDFGDVSKESTAETKIECVCGVSSTVGEFYSFKVIFVCGDGVSVKVYNTQDYTQEGTISTVAYARNGDNGELLNNGEGQVNFEIVLGLGYKLKENGISIGPSKYKNLKSPTDTKKENTYRITKITGEITVTIETEIDCAELPVMVINTEDATPIVDKVNYINCSVSVLNTETEYCFEGTSASIKGRGNTTWVMPKKPYKLKFDRQIDLFGNGEAKKWTLIANYCDKSLIRNYLAYTIGCEFDDIGNITTTTQLIDLYLNGEYQGVYLLCEQVETGKNRVDIENDINSYSPGDIGFLLEMDGKVSSEGTESIDYVVSSGKNFAIKSPDYEDVKSDSVIYSEYVAYIQKYLDDMFVALKSNDYDEVLKYLDVNSFADSYILNELFNTCDVGYFSFYIYKKENGVMYSGPVWDFDISSGNCNYNVSSDYNELWAKETNPIYNYLLNYDEFSELVATKLLKYKDIIQDTIDNKIETFYTYKNSIDRNFEKWDILSIYVWPNPDEIVALTTWQEQVEYVRTWLLRSLDYILSVYCTEDI